MSQACTSDTQESQTGIKVDASKLDAFFEESDIKLIPIQNKQLPRINHQFKPAEIDRFR